MQLKRWMGTFAIFAAMLQAEPQVAMRGVTSAGASAVESGVARGSAFVIRGAGLGPEERVTGEIPYGAELGGVRVALQPRGEGSSLDALMIEASATRLIAIVPSAAAAGVYDLTVAFAGETSKPVRLKVVESNPGIVTAGFANGGLAVAQIGEGETIRMSYSTPALAGQWITLEAAGLGPVENDAEAPGEQPKLEEAAVMVGDVEIPVTYAGRSPERPGFDRVVFRLAEEGLAPGCVVPIVLKAGDFESQPAHLAVGSNSGEPCVHPAGLSPESLRRLDNGETLVMPSLDFSESTMEFAMEGEAIEMKSRSLQGIFLEHTQETLGAGALAYFSVYSKNGCYVVSSEGAEIEVGEAKALDAGEKLNVTGAAGFQAEVPRKEGNEYSFDLGGGGFPGLPNIPGLPSIPGLPGAAPALEVLAGRYEAKGPGGADVEPFSAALELSAPVSWSNRKAIEAVDREAGLELTWTPGPARDRILITGFAGQQLEPETEEEMENPRTVGASFICETTADKGAFQVPAEVLKRLPRTDGLENAFGMLMLSHGNKSPNGDFRVKTKDGRDSEIGSFGFQYSWSKTVRYQ